MNNAIPDHEPSKNDVYLPEKRSPEHHPMVQFLLGGFGNWDSEYFIMIAEHGYLYEQSLAFFPLLPWVMNMTSSIVYSSTGLSQATSYLCKKLASHYGMSCLILPYSRINQIDCRTLWSHGPSSAVYKTIAIALVLYTDDEGLLG